MHRANGQSRWAAAGRAGSSRCRRDGAAWVEKGREAMSEFSVSREVASSSGDRDGVLTATVGGHSETSALVGRRPRV